MSDREAFWAESRGWPADWRDRRRVFVLDRRGIAAMLAEGLTFRVRDAAPAESIVLGVADDFAADAILVHVAHPSFDAVEPGAQAPWSRVLLERIDIAVGVARDVLAKLDETLAALAGEKGDDRGHTQQ